MKTHYASQMFSNMAVCGRKKDRENYLFHSAGNRLELITCKKCLRHIYKSCINYKKFTEARIVLRRYMALGGKKIYSDLPTIFISKEVA